MPADVPIIYSPRFGPNRLQWPWRILALGIAAACFGVLLVAAGLEPDANGMGTHKRLGLADCTFLGRTNLPCPSCGMTTSFAYFAHGNLPASFYVQPAGFLLAILTTMMFWACLYVSVTGRAVHRAIRWGGPMPYLVALFSVGVAAWAWKIFIHVRRMDGWGT